jgi:GST-like protein
MAGQCNHFRLYAREKIPYAIERYTKEVERLFSVMEKRLSDRPYLAGSYSIADIASFPWARTWKTLAQDITKFPNVGRWLDLVAARPAVKKGLALKKDSAARKQA